MWLLELTLGGGDEEEGQPQGQPQLRPRCPPVQQRRLRVQRPRRPRVLLPLPQPLQRLWQDRASGLAQAGPQGHPKANADTRPTRPGQTIWTCRHRTWPCP